MEEENFNQRDEIRYFMEKNIKVHVKLISKVYLNGYFVKKFESSAWEFRDEVFGLMVLDEKMIKKVEEFKGGGK